MCIFLQKSTLQSRARHFSTPASNSIVTSTFPSIGDIFYLLKNCKLLPHCKILHQQALVRGLLNSFSGTNIIAAYITCRSLHDALFAVERYTPSSNFWWNELIREDVSQGFLDHALHLYRRMQCLGTKPDHFTFPFVLKACGELSSYRRGASIHSVICRNGFELNVFVCNALMAMYSRCGYLTEAIHVFYEIINRGIDDLVSWNSVIAAYVQNACMHLALNTFRNLAMAVGDAVEWRPDVISIVNVLPACASLKLLPHGKEVHCFALRNGLFSDLFVGNAIVDLYAKCGVVTFALTAFKAMDIRDVVSWNVMVTGYSQSGNFCEALVLIKKMHEEKIALNVVTWSALISGCAQSGYPYRAIDVFREMQLSDVAPNAITLISLLSACAAVGALQRGKEAHAFALRRCLFDENGEGEDNLVQNALIDMYSKCENLIAAQLLFDAVPSRKRNVVTWTVMIGGHAQHGDANTALKLFYGMLVDPVSCYPNDFTISCVLVACARLSALQFGKQIHSYVIRRNCETAILFVGNCLIEMYSKCGNIDASQRVFDMMPEKNDVSWTSLMNGYAMLGHGAEALNIFEKMQQAGFVPDGITFLVILYACNHAGMVDKGMKYFYNMNRDFGVVAEIEHYACAVDLLGRAGRLGEAQELIGKMPMKPTTIVWVALLGACRIHTDVELAEYASQKLLELNSESDGTYTLLSNIYASAGRWEDVGRIRVLMKRSGIKKRPGCSWIQGKKGTSTVTFFSGDKSHPQFKQVYDILTDLMQQIKAMGYVPQTGFALHDVDAEEKSSLLFEHSEKLALAYGILTSIPGTSIRITKNLRVCGDCHNAFTFISKIIDHEIILRDSSRFHHFKKGSCSCGDYW